jgi:hypothetical protein
MRSSPGYHPGEREAHRFMVMQTGYFDDSGSHAASQYYVLAGFVAPVSDWKLVSDEWAHTINEEGLSYFKMSHAMAMDGQFKRGWTIPLRDQLILKLVKPMQRRMRAAMAALPFEHPKLSVAVNTDVSSFAAQMEELSRRAGKSNVIDAQANRTTLLIQTDPTSDGRRR